MTADHAPGPSYQHPQPRQDCTCGAQFTGDTLDEAIASYRAHYDVARMPGRQAGRAGIARARQALADTIARRGERA